MRGDYGIIYETNDGLGRFEKEEDVIGCLEEKVLTAVVKKNNGDNTNYCIKKFILGEHCSYLRIDSGVQKCVYYEK